MAEEAELAFVLCNRISSHGPSLDMELHQSVWRWTTAEVVELMYCGLSPARPFPRLCQGSCGGFPILGHQLPALGQYCGSGELPVRCWPLWGHSSAVRGVALPQELVMHPGWAHAKQPGWAWGQW